MGGQSQPGLITVWGYAPPEMFWKYECAEAHFSAFWGIFSQLLGRLVSKTESLPHAVFPLLALAVSKHWLQESTLTLPDILMQVILQNARGLRKIISCDVIERVPDGFSFPAHGLHSWTNSITVPPQGFGKFSFQFNVANYIELLKTAC